MKESSTTNRTCAECGASLEGLHPNRKYCENCSGTASRKRDREAKGIFLAPDAPRCPVCGLRLNVITAGHYRKHGYKTAKEFKDAFDLSTLKAPSLCQRHSKFMSKNSPTKGKRRTVEERRLMSKRRKGKGVGVSGTYERTPEIRQKISRGVAAHHLSQSGDFTRGYFVECNKASGPLYVRSSWERRVVRILDLHPCVEWVEAEPFIIPYFLDGQKRRYVPDFLVSLEGGIKEVWEVKPRVWHTDPKNQAKFAALNEYVEERGWNARIVDLPDIEGMERQVGILPWKGPGGPWVRPDNLDFRPHSPREQLGLPDDSVE